MVLQEHAKYVVFIKELQSQVQTLQEFRSRVLQAFPHLDIGLYCSRAMAELPPKRNLKKFSEFADSHGQFQVKQSKLLLQKKNFHVQSRKVFERSLSSNYKIKIKRSRTVNRGNNCNKKFLEKSEVCDEDDCDETSIGTSNSFPSVPQIKGKCGKLKLDSRNCNCCIVHRQDSGFSTDGKDKLVSHPEEFEILTVSSASSSSASKTNKEDELMNILDIIEQRSITMRSIVERGAESRQENSKNKTIDEDELLAENDRLQFENEVLVDRMLNIEIDNKLYKEEINRLKDSLIEAEVARRLLEDRLEAAISEREQLGSRINRLHSKFVNKSPSTSTAVRLNSSFGNNYFIGSNSLPDRLGSATKLKVRVDKTKVSSILQESRTLELQKQLLMSFIRNEVLKCRLEQQESEWNQKVAKWQNFQSQLMKDCEVLRRVNNDLQAKIHKVSTELRIERTKRKVLERALHAAYRDITNVNNSNVTMLENVEYSKENVLFNTNKKKQNLLKHCVVNGYVMQKMHPDDDSRRPRNYHTNKLEEAPDFSNKISKPINNEAAHLGWVTQDQSPPTKSKLYHSNYRKMSEFDVDSQQQTLLINDGNDCEPSQLRKSTSTAHNYNDDPLNSEWKWSYRINDNVPDKKYHS